MYGEIFEALVRDGCVKTAAVLDGPSAGERCIWKEGRFCPMDEKGSFDWSSCQEMLLTVKETGIFKIGETRIFAEVYSRNPRLILLGGGHVSRPTVHLGAMLGFDVTVMDDREEFVKRERFPEAKELVLGDFSQLSQKLPEYENSYYVVVTRGHEGDTVCARQILKRPYRYFGMIGSRTKVHITRETLLKEGFSQRALDTIHAPIGLPIGGETPEEIAVSIAAEIIQEKNKTRESYADEALIRAVKEKRRGVMLTIVRKKGSSPRGIGSKMLLDASGKTWGTIGGGNAEYEALKYAAQLREAAVQTYRFVPGDSRSLGMICGGEAEVFFECI